MAPVYTLESRDMVVVKLAVAAGVLGQWLRPRLLRFCFCLSRALWF